MSTVSYSPSSISSAFPLFLFFLVFHFLFLSVLPLTVLPLMSQLSLSLPVLPLLHTPVHDLILPTFFLSTSSRDFLFFFFYEDSFLSYVYVAIP